MIIRLIFGYLSIAQPSRRSSIRMANLLCAVRQTNHHINDCLLKMSLHVRITRLWCGGGVCFSHEKDIRRFNRRQCTHEMQSVKFVRSLAGCSPSKRETASRAATQRPRHRQILCVHVRVGCGARGSKGGRCRAVVRINWQMMQRESQAKACCFYQDIQKNLSTDQPRPAALTRTLTSSSGA